MENNKNKKSVKFQGDMLNFCDFIQVFVFTKNHHLKNTFSSLYRLKILSHGGQTVENKRKITSCKVKVTLNLKNDCSSGLRC